jgi:manganese-dependent ADP-ribose/CDP-alcohol diphosphatase
VIVFSHVPILPQALSAACGDNGSLGCLGWNYPDALELLQQFNSTIAAVFSGHDHEGGFARDPVSGIPFVGVQSIFGAAEGQAAHGVVEVYSDRIEFRGAGRVVRSRAEMRKQRSILARTRL